MRKNNNTDIIRILRNFFITVLVISGIAILIAATQYAGDKTQKQLKGSGFETVFAEEIKNSCINFFNMLK